MRLIRASGAVADALRRYDRNLDVRYSWERRQWAITYRTTRPDLLPKPVRFTESEGGVLESLMPEKSEAYISYRTRTYPAAYVPKLSWDLYKKMIAADSMRRNVKTRLKDLAVKREAEYKLQQKDRWKEARSYLNWHARTHPMAE